jgi:hypothetical protein
VLNPQLSIEFEVIRAILRKAEREWEWLDKSPSIRLLKEDTRRIRWITHEEAKRLIEELPSHLADMAMFACLQVFACLMSQAFSGVMLI